MAKAEPTYEELNIQLDALIAEKDAKMADYKARIAELRSRAEALVPQPSPGALSIDLSGETLEV